MARWWTRRSFGGPEGSCTRPSADGLQPQRRTGTVPPGSPGDLHEISGLLLAEDRRREALSGGIRAGADHWRLAVGLDSRRVWRGGGPGGRGPPCPRGGPNLTRGGGGPPCPEVDEWPLSEARGG